MTVACLCHSLAFPRFSSLLDSILKYTFPLSVLLRSYPHRHTVSRYAIHFVNRLLTFLTDSHRAHRRQNGNEQYLFIYEQTLRAYRAYTLSTYIYICWFFLCCLQHRCNTVFLTLESVFCVVLCIV